MRRFLAIALSQVRNSYWFVPSAMTLVALLMGFVVPAIDAWAGDGWLEAVPFIARLEVEGARAMLSTIAGSTLGVAGVTFSIAIAAVSFASGNYGPRLIGNFMRDRGNQFTLGTFVAAFVYCVVVLRSIHSGSDGDAERLADFVPQIGVLVAMGLMLASIGVLIFFIHHVPESINIMNIAARIGLDLRDAVHTLFPDYGDEQTRTDEPAQSTDSDVAPPTMGDRGFDTDDAAVVTADAAGYLQLFDLDYLNERAGKDELVIRILLRPGSFVVEGDPVMHVWRDGGKRCENDIATSLREAFTIGTERSNFQDVLFLADQLVEIAARALSPGVNDPFTANACFDWLRAGLIEFVRRAPAHDIDMRGDERVVVFPVTFERVMESVMGQSRQYLAADRNACLHALATLAEVGHAARYDAQRHIVTHWIDELVSRGKAEGSEAAAREIVERGAAALLRVHEDVPTTTGAGPRPLEPVRHTDEGAVAA